MHPYVGWLGRHRLVTVQSSGELTTRNTVASSGALGLVHRSHRDQGVPWMVCGPGGEIVGERLVSVGLARAADSGIRGILDRVHRGELNWGMGKPGRKRRTNAKIGRLRVVCGNWSVVGQTDGGIGRPGAPGVRSRTGWTGSGCSGEGQGLRVRTSIYLRFKH